MCPSGDVPAEDPDHGTVLRVHAGPQAGHLPVDLAAHPDGRSGSCAGWTQFLTTVCVFVRRHGMKNHVFTYLKKPLNAICGSCI